MPESGHVWPRSSAISSYGFAVLAFAAAFACVSLLDHVLKADAPVSVFLCAIIFVAWFAGLGPALLASALSVLAFGYFYLLPINSLTLASRDLPRIVLFGIASLIVASVGAAQRKTAASLGRARDQLQGAVSDLKTLNEQLLRENAERKVAEQKTREAERELRATIDMVPALIARYRHDGTFDFVNRTWQAYTGLSQEGVRGRSRDIVIHPDDLALFDDAWRAHLTTGDPFEMEQRVRRADGQYRWHSVRRAPLCDENGEVVKWYGVALDCHDQKQAEVAQRKSEAYLDHAQQLSHTGSFGWNIASGDIVWSKEAYRILGIDRTVKPTLDLIMRHIPPDDYEFVRAELDRVMQGARNLDYEHRWLMPEGSVKQLHVRAHRVNYESGEEEIVGAMVDITEARRAQEALADAQAQLAHANRVATLGELAASIAHDVNQPLAAIVVNGEANLRWLDRPLPEIDAVRQGLEQMIADAGRASNLVHRVRALSRKNEPERVALDINEVINDVIKLVGREIISHQVSLRLELAAHLPPVFGDRVQLQQVIINLVINGIQAMADINSRARSLLIRSEHDESGQVLVSVQDSGNGIDPANANRLFDAFYTTKSGGMGLGLSICRSITEAHGGRIWASNHSGTGAVFSFTLPSHRELNGDPGLPTQPATDGRGCGRRDCDDGFRGRATHVGFTRRR
jgi:PAS domain S-box-containing protein